MYFNDIVSVVKYNKYLSSLTKIKEFSLPTIGFFVSLSVKIVELLCYKLLRTNFPFQVFDERRNCWLYTLDKGVTKFYDLLQLIEFYQLNAGSLPTRLTHYVQNGVSPPPSRPEDGGASPSPPEASQRFNDKAECGNPTNI